MRLLSLMLTMMTLHLDLPSYVLMLAVPGSLHMDSVDMRHTLQWRPLLDACNTTLLYSVQFQGEFELTVLNGSWVDAPECQRIARTYCDLTFDLGSDSDYNLQVQAQCGPTPSPWRQLSPPFNRKDTTLTSPDMKVKFVSDTLHVTFDQLPPTAVVVVTVWRRGAEQQPSVHTLAAEKGELSVAALQEDAVYCVQAQTLLHSQISSSTEPLCVRRPGGEVAWRQHTAVGVSIAIMAAFLFAVSWSVTHCRTDACRTYFHKKLLPHALDVHPLPEHQLAWEQKGAELCQQLQVLANDDLDLETSISRSDVSSAGTDELLANELTSCWTNE